MSEHKPRHFQDWWRHKFGFVPHGDRVVCTLCHKSIVTRTSSVRRHFNTKHGPLIPPSFRAEYIKKCVAAFENMQPKPELDSVPGSGRSHDTPSPKKGNEGNRSPSPDSKICLKWNTYHTNIQTIFPTLLLNEQFVDVTLACEGRFMKCHKVILSACSPYFEELLTQNPCQHPIVLMKDIKFWEVRALVEFMYSGEVNVTEEKLPSLLRAAEALQVKGLTNVNQTSTTTNDSADSEDSPVSKFKGALPKSGRRKRKLSDSTGKSNDSSQNDLPAENKLFKDGPFTPQPTSTSNKDSSNRDGDDYFESSHHPPLEETSAEASSIGQDTLDNNDSSKQGRLSDESSHHDSDSEQEKYIFNMDRKLLTDDTIYKAHRVDRQERLRKPINRIQDLGTMK